MTAHRARALKTKAFILKERTPRPVSFVVFPLGFRCGRGLSHSWFQDDQAAATERLPDGAAGGRGEGDPGRGGGHGDGVPGGDGEDPAGEREPPEAAAGPPAAGGRDGVAA